MARQRDEQKRQLIIDTSIRLFSEKGFHATSIQDIVAESGLSVGTIYLYFANKEEIFDGILDSGLESFSLELFRQIPADLEPDEIAERFIKVIIEVLGENIQVVTVLTNELSFQEKLQGFYSKIAENISDKYMGSSDEESLYNILNMTRKEFNALVTILISGLCNAMRLAAGSNGSLIRMEDIQKVMHDIVLRSLLERIEK